MLASISYPNFQAFDNLGNYLIGGKLYTYYAGTDDPKETFSDAANLESNTNPVILNARGEAPVFGGGTYKIVLKDANDVLILTLDNLIALNTLTIYGNSLANWDYLTPEMFDPNAGTPGWDASDAIETATNTFEGGRVKFGREKTYLITRPLNITVNSYYWQGAVPARGCVMSDTELTKIVYENPDATQYMVSKSAQFATVSNIGPFVHENIKFYSATCHRFFKFGKEDFDDDGYSNEVIDAQDQSYILGVKFIECAFQCH